MTGETYATAEEYRALTGDGQADEARVTAMLGTQSAKLRALARIAPGRALTDDQLALCRELVCDAVRKALVQPTSEWGLGAPGLTQASFSANGFSQSVQYSNASGSAYFDRSTLSALMRSLGSSQSVGTVVPSYGALS